MVPGAAVEAVDMKRRRKEAILDMFWRVEEEEEMTVRSKRRSRNTTHVMT